MIWILIMCSDEVPKITNLKKFIFKPPIFMIPILVGSEEPTKMLICCFEVTFQERRDITDLTQDELEDIAGS